MSRPLAIDLFSGLGGWSEALIEVGYYTVGFDIEQHVYGEHRYPGQLVIQDVLTLHGSQFKDAALIVASPPCQEYSYMAMPWSRAKAKAATIRADKTGKMLADLTRLFDACFRIQREACEAAGRHIPMVVENVRGAQPWVGRARWGWGSFYLWGDVPALMPPVMHARKVPGFRFDGSGRSFQTASVEGVKHDNSGWRENGTLKSNNRMVPDGTKHGGDWFRDPDCPSRQGGQTKVAEGRKGAGAGAEWFDQNLCVKSSNSSARKFASAMIAKIPEPLARHVARTFYPRPHA